MPAKSTLAAGMAVAALALAGGVATPGLQGFRHFNVEAIKGVG